MRWFLVKFFYNTDNRFQAKVEAMNEAEALVIALKDLRVYGPTTPYWITESGFTIKVELF